MPASVTVIVAEALRDQSPIEAKPKLAPVEKSIPTQYTDLKAVDLSSNDIIPPLEDSIGRNIMTKETPLPIVSDASNSHSSPVHHDDTTVQSGKEVCPAISNEKVMIAHEIIEVNDDTDPTVGMSLSTTTSSSTSYAASAIETVPLPPALKVSDSDDVTEGASMLSVDKDAIVSAEEAPVVFNAGVDVDIDADDENDDDDLFDVDAGDINAEVDLSQEDEEVLEIYQEYVSTVPSGVSVQAIRSEGGIETDKEVVPEMSVEELKSLLIAERKEEGEAKRVRNAAARDAESMTEEMKNDVISLLNAFGLPYVIAPYEAEAQCAGNSTLLVWS